MNSFRQRREKILATIYEKRHVTARDLAVALSASEATVRRDLRAMAAEGDIDLVYGGATIRRVSISHVFLIFGVSLYTKTGHGTELLCPVS